MRIGIFTESFCPVVNGASYSVQSFAKHLTRMGHEVHVFAPHYPGYVDTSDYPVHRYPGILTPYEQGYNIAVPIWPSMVPIMRQARLQIIHTQSPFVLGTAGARWARWLNLPLVMTNHTLYTEYVHYVPLPKVVSRIGVVAWTRLYCNRTDRVIVPTEPIRQVLLDYGVTRPICVAPTGVDLSAVRAADPAGIREQYGIAPDAELIVFVGRLAKEKNVCTLIEAFTRIAAARSKAHLMLVGGGQEEVTLRALVKEQGLESRVTFAGWQKPRSRNRHLRAGDLFLFPSVTDTQGLVLCEALAAGLPCVAADAYGSKAVIRHGEDGLLVEATPDALARGALDLLVEPGRRERMAKTAAEGADRFSERAATERLLSIYEDALAEPRPSRPRIFHAMAGFEG
ncbi:MAG: glycosyltransferase [Armatimonadetes bacterium]|nr:glycosyltransferase [Armatimonadota bacterium]